LYEALAMSTHQLSTTPDPSALRETNLSIARELGEMHLIHTDLINSLISLSTWSDEYTDHKNPTPTTEAIADSLFRDGINQFVGCFDSKNAYPLVVENVYPAVEGVAVYFRWLRSLRNSYAAHRHGSARQCVFGVMINPETGDYLGMGNLNATYRGPSREGHEALLGVIKMAIQFVETKISTLTNQFAAQAQGLSCLERLALKPAGIQPQAPETMGISRGDIKMAIAKENIPDAKG
jgi:hypothetical protein